MRCSTVCSYLWPCSVVIFIIAESHHCNLYNAKEKMSLLRSPPLTLFKNSQERDRLRWKVSRVCVCVPVLVSSWGPWIWGQSRGNIPHTHSPSLTLCLCFVTIMASLDSFLTVTLFLKTRQYDCTATLTERTPVELKPEMILDRNSKQFFYCKRPTDTEFF